MKRILVTGGAGFIGRHLCASHLADRDDVICLDNFFTSRRANVADFLEHPHFELVRHDVCEPFHFEVDLIYHLACPAAPLHYTRNGARTLETAFLGTLHALRCAREARARIVSASTSEVYGNPTVHPQAEGYWGHVNPIGPRSVYDEGKRAAEALCMSYALLFGVDVRIARIFNTYGPYMARNDGRVIPSFLEALAGGQPLTIHGRGSQTRSFCYVTDLVAGLRKLGELPGPLEHPVNLGNPEEIRIAALAEKIGRLAPEKFTVREAPNPVGDDPERRCPDITLARAYGWSPSVSLDEGLARTWAWWLSSPSSPA